MVLRVYGIFRWDLYELRNGFVRMCMLALLALCLLSPWQFSCYRFSHLLWWFVSTLRISTKTIDFKPPSRKCFIPSTPYVPTHANQLSSKLQIRKHVIGNEPKSIKYHHHRAKIDFLHQQKGQKGRYDLNSLNSLRYEIATLPTIYSIFAWILRFFLARGCYNISMYTIVRASDKADSDEWARIVWREKLVTLEEQPRMTMIKVKIICFIESVYTYLRAAHTHTHRYLDNKYGRTGSKSRLFYVSMHTH